MYRPIGNRPTCTVPPTKRVDLPARPPVAFPAPLQAVERQSGELADAQSHAKALEVELEGKAREGAALLADTLALKARVLPRAASEGS